MNVFGLLLESAKSVHNKPAGYMPASFMADWQGILTEGSVKLTADSLARQS